MVSFPRGPYPITRMRRQRSHHQVRRLICENSLHASDLVWPCFITDNPQEEGKIDAMPGVKRYSLTQIVSAVAEAEDLGIPAIALFPYTLPSKRDAMASEALNAKNLVCEAIALLKQHCPNMIVICDVALDPYTESGHDGVMRGGTILNDETVAILQKQAVIMAEAGCDVLAPSDMMDGRVGAVRSALDQQGFSDRLILSYAVKYASCFYSPFREAVGSNMFLKGDKMTYQMDPRNSDEALHEVALDLQEGADWIIVKPGMPYLDVIHRVVDEFAAPTLAYQVSGEYAMIAQAAENGWLDLDRAMMESLIAFKRAGCRGIVTYFAKQAATLLQGQSG